MAIAKITPNSPADKIGLKVNDELIEINGQSLTEAGKLPIVTKENAGKKINVKYRRDGKESAVDVQLNDKKSVKGSGYLGVIPGQTEKMYSTWSAPIVGVATTGQLSYETIKGVGFVAALISLTLAVMNILPIPALDGGRWFTMTTFRLFKKDLTKEREENIQATGMLILLILTILVTISDVGKFF